jgi:hypothetical protein
MPVDITYSTDEQEREVRLMSDADVDLVSIVRRSANWTPFVVVKGDKTDQTNADTHTIDTHKQNIIQEATQVPGEIIQSVFLPNTEKWDEFASNDGTEWARNVEVKAKSESTAWTKYTLVPADRFMPGSLRLCSLGRHMGTCGKLSEGVTVEKAGVLSAAVNGSGPDAIDQPQFPSDTVASVIREEIDAFQTILWSALSQNTSKPQQRKQTVMNSLGAFWDFLSSLMDTIGPSDTVTVAKNDTQHQTEITEKRKMNDETLAQIVKGVTDLTAIVTDLQAKAVSKAEAPAEPDGYSELVAQVAKSVERLDELGSRLDSLVHSVSGGPPATDPDPAQATNVAKGDKIWEGAWV